MNGDGADQARRGAEADRSVGHGVAPEGLSRSDFLRRVPLFAAAGGLLFTALAFLRSLVPSHVTGASQALLIGRPGDYATGMVKVFADDGVIVFCDKRGLHAMSLTCTHLGCAVHFDRRGFHCPCHGSRYRLDGQVVKGPAPRALPWFRIVRLPNGDLAVERGRLVRPGTRFPLSTTRVRRDGPPVVHHG